MNATIFKTIRHDLHNRYGHAVDAETIDLIVDETYAAHKRTAAVSKFLPILVEREAVEKIERLYTERTVFPAARKRIVFVSRGNRALADAAAAIASRLGGDAVLAASAATHPENVHDSQLETVAAERGVDMRETAVYRGAERTLESVAAVVYLTPNETHDINALRAFVWDFKRTDGMTLEQTRELADDLGARVQSLLLNLNVPVASGAALAA